MGLFDNLKPGDEIPLPKQFDKEKYYEKFSRFNKKKGQPFRINFDCEICGKRYYDYKDFLEHLKNIHGDILKRYAKPKDYSDAVKRGEEPDIKKDWREHEYD